MELSNRLEAVARLLSKDLVVADVGTDHGYIPIYLIETGKCKNAFAMDINAGPLLRAKGHIAEHGLEKQIEVRQSDGVKALNVGECDSVIVAGMGGALAIKIMEEGKTIFKSLKEFVLQPQSELEKVRLYLCENAYRIVDEDIVFEDGKFYPMMKVVNEQSESYRDVEFRFGKLLLKQQHPVLKAFLDKELKKKETIIKNLHSVEGEHIEVRIQELKDEMGCIKEALKAYR